MNASLRKWLVRGLVPERQPCSGDRRALPEKLSSVDNTAAVRLFRVRTACAGVNRHPRSIYRSSASVSADVSLVREEIGASLPIGTNCPQCSGRHRTTVRELESGDRDLKGQSSRHANPFLLKVCNWHEPAKERGQIRSVLLRNSDIPEIRQVAQNGAMTQGATREQINGSKAWSMKGRADPESP
jgi:hypothetical protein